MKTGNDDIEYMEIVSEILKNREFNKLKDFARGVMLHDFF